MKKLLCLLFFIVILVASNCYADSVFNPFSGEIIDFTGDSAGSVSGATTEEIEDIVGAMTTGNTETGIDVTYQDGTADIDFVVNIDTMAELQSFIADATVMDTTQIDTFAELQTLVVDATILDTDAIDTFAELQAMVTDTTILDTTQISTEAELEGLLTDTSNVIVETEIDTFSELQAIVADATVMDTTQIDTSAKIIAIVSDETGTGALVFATSPTLITPTLGVASATTVNNITITAPAAAGTLTIADGKTLTATNTVNLNTMTDGKWCKYTAAGTVLNCDQDAPGGAEVNNLETVMTDVLQTEIAIGGSGGDVGGYYALSGDATMTDFGVVTVVDDSHNHVITNIDSFTKANLETQTSDVSDFAEADGDTYAGAHDFGSATMTLPDNATTVDSMDAIDSPADTECLAYDAGTDRLEWVTCGAGGASNFYWEIQPQQAKLPTTNPMGIDAGNERWRGLLDDTTSESATWEGVLYPFNAGTLKAKVFYTLETTSTSDVVAFNLNIDCVSDADATVDTPTWGTSDSIDSAAQSLTAGTLDVLSDASLNEDSCAEYDTMVVRVLRDVGADGTTDDVELRKILIYEE